MAIYPGAIWQPLAPQYVPSLQMHAYNRMNVHITATLGNPFNFFNSPGRASSHFFVTLAGVIYQFIDTRMRAEGDYEGNDATISVENEGRNGPLTEAQVQANAAIFKWLRDTHGIQNKIATDSKIGDSSKGLSWHRLGIDGNFPAGLHGGRLQHGGGMRYSLSFGKTCPTDPTIDQIQRIFDLSQGVIVVDNPLPPPVQPPPPPPPPPYRVLAVDGQWGTNTTLRLQDYFNTSPEDGVISHQWKSAANQNLFSAQWDTTKIGSNVIRALQAKVGTGTDGLCGPGTIRALQAYLGTNPDGVISDPSDMVKALQRRLNANNL